MGITSWRFTWHSFCRQPLKEPRGSIIGDIMKVIVLGAGIVGVTSAYQLAKAGHDVTVIDRQKGPAMETSFANAGEVSFGYCSPWAAPGIPMKAMKWLFMQHAPLILRPKIDAAMLCWIAKMLANCTSERYAINKSRMLRLADYSRISLAALRKETGIEYDERMQGTLQLFRTQAQLDASGKDVKALAADGIPYEVLDRDGCVRAEPALAHVREKIVGGLLTPKDETGDCFKFTNALAKKAEQLGVRFSWGTEVKKLDVEGGKLRGAVTNWERLAADAVVVALGSYSPLLLKRHGIKLPVYPVKGFADDPDHPMPPAHRNRRSWTRPTKSPSPDSATASASAAWRKSPATPMTSAPPADARSSIPSWTSFPAAMQRTHLIGPDCAR